MGFFSGMYTKEGPGVSKNAPQKKGVARFFEMWMRDAGQIWRVSLLATLCFLPSFAALLFGVLFRNYVGMILIALVVYTAGAALTGPALCGMHAVLIKILRDEPAYLMHTFKKAWKDNLRQSIPAGIVLMLLLAAESISGFYFLSGNGGSASVIMVAISLFCLIVALGAGLFLFAQMLFLELPLGTLFKNSLLLEFGYIKRSLPASFLLLAGILAMVMVPSVFVWFVVAVLGLPGLLALWADMLIWPVMEKSFSITERQKEKRAAEDASPL